MKLFVRLTDDKNQSYEGVIELKKVTNKKEIKKLTSVEGPTDIVRELYFQNYFETSRTLNDVENKIKSKKYNFDSPAIVLALSRSKYLKRQGKRGSYSYIQKIPPN